ncbi:MAG: ABC transporter ATP-binding protein [Acidimicrobiales bacterium]
MPEPVIEVAGLGRTYTTSIGVFRRQRLEVPALVDVTFDVERQEIFGLVGPNGAGKTTAIKILTTLLLPTTGSAKVLGHDVTESARRIRPSINFVFGGERGLYWRLSAEDNMRYFADLYRIAPSDGKRRSDELLSMVGLFEQRHQRVEEFSKGMKQRLHLAKSLVNDPDVLFLDEPSIGLDPIAARDLRQLVQTIRSMRGTTVLLTSHYMWEMEELSDRIAVLIDGRISKLDTPSVLRSTEAGTHVVELTLTDAANVAILEKQAAGLGPTRLGDRSGRRVLSVHTSAPAEVVTTFAADTQSGVAEIIVRDSQLEDAYLLMVGR